jgi:hypothetical protein
MEFARRLRLAQPTLLAQTRLALHVSQPQRQSLRRAAAVRVLSGGAVPPDEKNRSGPFNGLTWSELLDKMSGQTGAQPPPPATTKFVAQSALGSALGIGAMSFLHFFIADGHDYTLILGSFGASCVLVFGAPVAPFAQPRHVVVGHCLSALVGVTAMQALPAPLAAPLAVAGAVAAMQLTNTVHPPAGGTALLAVVGSPAVHAMGYGLLFPTLMGSLTIVGTGLAFNNIMRDIKYPQYW